MNAKIMIATDSASDAELVKKLLRDEFDDIASSTNPDRAIEDFARHRPAVLVLAFDSLEKSERYYLGLYRLGDLVHALEHRTVILCSKDDLQRVYALCKKEYFDDYVLFWPVPHDALRLPMAIHHAVRRLTAPGAAGPTTSEFAAQARRLPAVEAILRDFSERDAQRPDAAARLQPEAQRDLALALDTTRSLQAMAERVRPLLLVVDDDEFQHTLVRRLLEHDPFEMAFASSGSEALAALRKCQPDLILMDVEMPVMDGVEATRRIKSVARFARIPILMITGHSDKDVVVQSIKAGAAGFVVKPFNRETLCAKIQRCLQGAEAAATT